MLKRSSIFIAIGLSIALITLTALVMWFSPTFFFRSANTSIPNLATQALDNVPHTAEKTVLPPYVPGPRANLYVSPSGDDNAPGNSPQTALRTISAAWLRLPMSQTGDSYRLNLPVVTRTAIYQNLYASPDGNDDAVGNAPDQPLRTISAAWARLPVASQHSDAYRILLLPGTYPCEPGPEDSNCINFFSDRSGSPDSPIVIQALNGPGTVTIRGGMNISNVHYLQLIDLNLVGGGALPTNSSGNNLLHIDASSHLLLRGLSVLGPDCPNDTCNNLQEVLKVNQTSYLDVENSRIGGAWHSAVDFFVVQYGHFRNNQIHTAGQWCMYIKGGSAYLDIQGNDLHNCQLGFQSGQSANLAVMRSPWFHYETYAIRFTNNILHDIPGVGLSAAGAYNTLFAYNTLYRVGTSKEPGYPLLQLVYGERNCTPIDEIPNVISNCPLFTAQGAWGPTMQTDSLPAIPNRRVYFYNNIFYNPAPDQTLYSHFNIPGPMTAPPGFVNVPSPTLADQDVIFAGNLIWNGAPDMPLGIEAPDQGCQPNHPTCNPTALTTANQINTIEPQLLNPANGDFHILPGGNLAAISAVAIPDFTWDSFTPAVPTGELNNLVALDRDSKLRAPAGPPGAYTLP